MRQILYGYGPSVFDQYRGHGDSFPPVEKLESWRSELSEHPDPMRVLLGAYILVDLALTKYDCANESLDEALDQIDEVLEDYSEAHNNYGVEGNPRIQKYIASCAVYAANIHSIKAQLGLNGGFDEAYYEILEKLDWLSLMSQTNLTSPGRPIVAEFIPGLLVLRAGGELDEFRAGRQAQMREDVRLKGLVDPEQNKSWDYGLTFIEGGDGVVNPDVKIQVKVKKQKKANSYRNAGIVPLALSQIGINDMEAFVNGIVEEEGLGGSEAGAYSTSQIDDITEKLLYKLSEEQI